jgi:hypothetical protein
MSLELAIRPVVDSMSVAVSVTREVSPVWNVQPAASKEWPAVGDRELPAATTLRRSWGLPAAPELLKLATVGRKRGLLATQTPVRDPWPPARGAILGSTAV